MPSIISASEITVRYGDRVAQERIDIAASAYQSISV